MSQFGPGCVKTLEKSGRKKSVDSPEHAVFNFWAVGNGQIAPENE
jgi:hypothetical protein